MVANISLFANTKPDGVLLYVDIYCTLHGSSTYIINFDHMHELILKSECQAFTILFCEKRKIKFFGVYFYGKCRITHVSYFGVKKEDWPWG